MSSLSAVAIIVLALLIAAALFLMYEIGKLVGEKTAAEKFPEAKKAAVQRSRRCLAACYTSTACQQSPTPPFRHERR